MQTHMAYILYTTYIIGLGFVSYYVCTCFSRTLEVLAQTMHAVSCDQLCATLCFASIMHAQKRTAHGCAIVQTLAPHAYNRAGQAGPRTRCRRYSPPPLRRPRSSVHVGRRPPPPARTDDVTYGRHSGGRTRTRRRRRSRVGPQRGGTAKYPRRRPEKRADASRETGRSWGRW